jgi:hypothetical protein
VVLLARVSASRCGNCAFAKFSDNRPFDRNSRIHFDALVVGNGIERTQCNVKRNARDTFNTQCGVRWHRKVKKTGRARSEFFWQMTPPSTGSLLASVGVFQKPKFVRKLLNVRSP